MFYACSQLVLNIANLIWFAVMQKPVFLGKPGISTKLINKIWTRLSAGTLGYIVAAIVGMVAAPDRPRPAHCVIDPLDRDVNR